MNKKTAVSVEGGERGETVTGERGEGEGPGSYNQSVCIPKVQFIVDIKLCFPWMSGPLKSGEFPEVFVGYEYIKSMN